MKGRDLVDKKGSNLTESALIVIYRELRAIFTLLIIWSFVWAVIFIVKTIMVVMQ